MESNRKLLAVGCALAIAGCAQGNLGGSPGALGSAGFSALPSLARSGARLAHLRGRSGSLGPAIYVFAGQPDAATPQVALTSVGSMLYGTTYYGGADNLGAVYSVTASGTETVMHSFTGSDGENPDGPLTNVKGTLYGTTYQGGAASGTVFSITPSGTYNVVYNFGVASGDCSEPDSAMIYVASKKALYGTAYRGGAHGEGCIFKLSLAGKTPKLSIVYSFTGSASSPAYASAPVFYNGALYVTTPAGGNNDLGAVLKIALSGTESVIYSFKDAPDGATPQAPLTVMNGTLYGTTEAGGIAKCGNYAGCGTVFKVTSAGKEKVIYRFQDGVSKIDAVNPQTALTPIGGSLYGVTPGCSGNGCGQGIVYSVTPSGVETVIFDFVLPRSSPDGYPENPLGPVVSLNGTIYGTTEYSAHTGYGTVYALP